MSREQGPQSLRDNASMSIQRCRGIARNWVSRNSSESGFGSRARLRTLVRADIATTLAAETPHGVQTKYTARFLYSNLEYSTFSILRLSSIEIYSDLVALKFTQT